METKIESKFVKTFIRKDKQDRLIFELSSASKRMEALAKFAHDTENYIKAQNIYLQGNKLSAEDAEREINKLTGDTKNCYILSEVSETKLLPLRSALEKCFDGYGETIVVVNENVAFLKAETERGAPMKYILYNKVQNA